MIISGFFGIARLSPDPHSTLVAVVAVPGRVLPIDLKFLKSEIKKESELGASPARLRFRSRSIHIARMALAELAQATEDVKSEKKSREDFPYWGAKFPNAYRIFVNGLGAENHGKGLPAATDDDRTTPRRGDAG
jgi:hypothetical protein